MANKNKKCASKNFLEEWNDRKSHKKLNYSKRKKDKNVRMLKVSLLGNFYILDNPSKRERNYKKKKTEIKRVRLPCCEFFSAVKSLFVVQHETKW